MNITNKNEVGYSVNNRTSITVLKVHSHDKTKKCSCHMHFKCTSFSFTKKQIIRLLLEDTDSGYVNRGVVINFDGVCVNGVVVVTNSK